MEQTDQHFPSLFKGFEITQPSIECKGCGTKVKRMCIFRECNSFSLHCDNDKCQKSYQRHGLCKSVTLDGVTNLLKQNYSANREFLSNLFEMEQVFIQKIRKTRDEIIKKLSYGNFEDKYQKIIDEIYRKGNGEFLKGKEADELFKKLLQLSQFNKDKCEEYHQQFKKKAENMMKNIIALREKLVTYIQPIKKEVNLKTIDSKILLDDAEGKDKIDFLLKQLSNPQSIKLLFRASQHSFSVAEFHKYCNNIPNTITIIRTEFNKTIAAFTPLQWKSINKQVNDPSRGSFLLQLELKEKMALIQEKQDKIKQFGSRPTVESREKQSYAIYDHQNYGPTFGGGHDIRILDKCNLKNNSYANFPHTYNYGNKYKNNQQSCTAFSGNPNGYNFRVLEYEVFEVIK